MDLWPRSRRELEHRTPALHGICRLAALNATGADLFSVGRFKEAVPVFERTLADCRVELGPDHVSTLVVAGNLAVAHVVAGRRREGIALISANLADRVRVLGDEEPRTLAARDALAAAHGLVGDVDDALRLASLVTEQRRRLLGATDPDTLTSRMGLIRAVAAAGEVKTAVALLAEAISDAEAAHGPRHTHTRALLECGQNSGLIRRER